MRLVILTLLLLQAQDSDISRWIEDLGHEEPGRRDEAQAQLLKAGEAGLATLIKARESATGERAHRLDAVIEEVERPERERKHDARERALRVEVYTVDFKDLRAVEAFEQLFKITKCPHIFRADPDPKVTLSLKDAPLQKILDALEDQLNVSIRWASPGWEITRIRGLGRPRAYLPGYTIEFKARPCSIGGKYQGIRIKAAGDGYGTLGPESWEIRGADGTERKFKTCPECRLVLVETGEDEKLTVRLKGNIYWFSRYELVVPPEESRTWRVGDCRIQYDFPKVTVSTADGSTRTNLPYATLAGEFKVEQADPHGSLGMGGRFGLPERKQGSWCDCLEGGTFVPEKVNSRSISKYEDFKPTDFKSMKVLFYKPMTEPFDTGVITLD